MFPLVSLHVVCQCSECARSIHCRCLLLSTLLSCVHYLSSSFVGTELVKEIPAILFVGVMVLDCEGRLIVVGLRTTLSLGWACITRTCTAFALFLAMFGAQGPWGSSAARSLKCVPMSICLPTWKMNVMEQTTWWGMHPTSWERPTLSPIRAQWKQ